MHAHRNPKIAVWLLPLTLGGLALPAAGAGNDYQNDRLSVNQTHSPLNDTPAGSAAPAARQPAPAAAPAAAQTQSSAAPAQPQPAASPQAQTQNSAAQTQPAASAQTPAQNSAGQTQQPQAHGAPAVAAQTPGQSGSTTQQTPASGAAGSQSAAQAQPAAAAPAGTSSQHTAATGNAKLQNLFQQAQFWHDKHRPDLARQSLNRVFLTDPDNADAIYLLALWSSEVGDTQEAEVWRKKLESINPNDPRLQSLDNANDLSSLSKELLTRARDLAASGNIPGAIEAYQKLFNGPTPPKALVSEYYLTMSGDPSRYPDAVKGVIQYIKANPKDIQAQLTYGKLLTYREETRRQGIEVLEYFAKSFPEADRGLRDALMWLEVTPEDEKYFMAYSRRHPEDKELLNRFNSSLVGGMASEAYQSMNSDNAARARDEFLQILRRSPDNPDALEGLGYLEMRAGNYPKAAEYLEHAAEVNPAKQNKLHFDALMAKARQAQKDGDAGLAQSITDEMLTIPGQDYTGIKMLKAEIFRKQRQYEKAEDLLREVLSSDPNNTGAMEVLYYVLQEAKKTGDATDLLAQMPSSLVQKIKSQQGKPYVDPSIGIRRKAAEYADHGNIRAAIDTLRQGIAKQPNSVWLRYDLARLLDKTGDKAGAQEQVLHLTRQGASNESLYAAAMLQGEMNNPHGASAALSRIGSAYNPKAVAELRDQILMRANMHQAEQYLASGQRTAALNTLRNIRVGPATTVADMGHLALLLQKAGDFTAALAMADEAASRPMAKNASVAQYADIISVYTATGNPEKARALSSHPVLVANSKPGDIEELFYGQIIQQADKLRTGGRSADAYDLLYNTLLKHPKDPELKMAMARIYQDNQRFEEAQTIYDSILMEEPTNQNALEGGINAALGAHDAEKAAALDRHLKMRNDPQLLMLKARVARENHHFRQAVDYLKQAKSLLEGTPYITALDPDDPAGGLTAASAVAQGVPQHAPNNPFRNDYSLSTGNQRQQVMPWEVMPGSQAPAAPAFSGSAMTIQQRQTLRDVNAMLRDLYEKTSTYASAQFEARQKDGEKGLSDIKEFRAPISVSTPLIGENRATLTVTPETMDAGTPDVYSNPKLGTNSMLVGVVTIQEAVNSLVYNALDITSQSYSSRTSSTAGKTSLATDINNFYLTFYGRQLGLDGDSANLQNYYNQIKELATLGYISADDFNMTSANGISSLFTALAKYGINSSTLSRVLNQYGSSASVAGSKAQRDHGVSASLSLEGELYKADIGVTPIGKDGTTFVGGLTFRPQLTPHTTLTVTAERRALRDSVLSYYGLVDNYSGKYWGGVTKNGVEAMISYDDGTIGAYGSLNYYHYTGEHVKSNSSYEAAVGIYGRVLKDEKRELTVGVDMRYMNFRNNQNHFTYGYGGYFSPKNYYSVSLPVNYTYRGDNLSATLNASIGYQSYTNSESPYFPTESQWQQTLELLQRYGVVESAYHEKESKSGISGNVGLFVDYNVNDAFSLGGSLKYNTFGDYKELSEMLYFKYLLGVL